MESCDRSNLPTLLVDWESAAEQRLDRVASAFSCTLPILTRRPMLVRTFLQKTAGMHIGIWSIGHSAHRWPQRRQKTIPGSTDFL